MDPGGGGDVTDNVCGGDPTFARDGGEGDGGTGGGEGLFDDIDYCGSSNHVAPESLFQRSVAALAKQSNNNNLEKGKQLIVLEDEGLVTANMANADCYGVYSDEEMVEVSESEEQGEEDSDADNDDDKGEDNDDDKGEDNDGKNQRMSGLKRKKVESMRKVDVEHTCGPSSEHCKVSCDWVAKNSEKALRTDPGARVETVIDNAKEKFGVEVPKNMAYRARKKALRVVIGDDLK
ncbi:hypothetical protein ACQ4PT_051519 [Festuca glaucescens]